MHAGCKTSVDGPAACCTILSVFGVIILFGMPLCPPHLSCVAPRLTNSAFGALFARHAETLVGSEEDPENPGSVAKLCYLAGFVYVGFLVFCGMQVSCLVARFGWLDADIGRWLFIIAILEVYKYKPGRDHGEIRSRNGLWLDH
jgi:hypothetical protein